jgi:hypothetical protein
VLRLAGRRYDERGITVPSPVAVLSLAAVALAGVAFVATNAGASADPVDTARPVTTAPSPTPTSTAPKPVIEKEKKPKKQPVRRNDVFVEVYNNSGISGLAGSTADTIAGAGWQVVGSDNWYGTIPASTVYYPDRLVAEGRLLAKDLGIKRLKPAISPMRLDRLTVILTADYS